MPVIAFDRFLAGLAAGSVKLIENLGGGWADKLKLAATANPNVMRVSELLPKICPKQPAR